MPGHPPSTATPWHALDLTETASALDALPDGLSSAEAAARLERYGPNAIAREPETTALQMLVDQFRSPLILLLLAAAAVMLAIGESVDAIVILLVVILNAAIGFAQERQAAKSVKALRAMLSATARILRDGHEVEIASAGIVPGDVVLLESGARVPADLRLTSATGLLIDESLLTGESESVGKHPGPLPRDTGLPDRASMAYGGTTVARGRGRGYVVATGDATEIGGIAEEMREVEHQASPLQLRLDRLARIVGIVVVICAVVAFAAGVASGRSTSEMFLVAVAVAVSAVPEGLPIAFTIALSVGVRAMARRNAIIRRLPVVETLGSATVIGSDKTGTLTENRMTVQRLWTPAGAVPVPPLEPTSPEPLGLPASLEAARPADLTLLCGALTNEATLSWQNGEWTSTGDPTDAALLASVLACGLDLDRARRNWPVVRDIPFEPERGYSASLRQVGDRPVLFVKGAPEIILPACAAMRAPDGSAPLDRDAVAAASRAMTGEGLRVLAMACHDGAESPGDLDRDGLPRDLVFLGIQGMHDPARAGAAEAVASCRTAGVRTIMITGDNRHTAATIARQLGITTDEDRVLTGAQLAAMNPDELAAAVHETDVFARVAPDQKLAIVQALQAAGEVVAVTGDGVNDAPALRAADIGIAMGKRGTDVAKEAADMVLADDNFSTIVAAVEEGRTTFDNVRKVVSFLFTTNAAEVLIIVAALLLDWPLPMIAVQILWLNLVTDSLQVMALAFEPREPDVMTRPPLGRQAGILTRALWQRVAISGVVMSIGTLALFRWALDHDTNEETAQTMALTTMVLFQMFQAFNSRSEKRSLLQMPLLGNRFLVVAVAASIVVHAGALYLPVTQYLLRVEPLSLVQWGMAILVSASILIVVEVHKAVIRRTSRAEAGSIP
jgi:Ca2+-transporting ATPase